MSKNFDFTIKLLMIGDSSVGKTSILNKYVTNKFTDEFTTTIGIDFHIKRIAVNNKIVKLQLWDTAGQERFRSVTIGYFRGAQGALVVYDITNRESFKNIKKWMEDIDKNCYNGIIIFLVGNKIDEIQNRKVSTEEGEELGKKYNINYFECSAKTGKNIEELYFNIATIISKKIIEEQNLSKPVPIVIQSEVKKQDRKWISC
jgi:Ras-related protein Rab-8A